MQQLLVVKSRCNTVCPTAFKISSTSALIVRSCDFVPSTFLLSQNAKKAMVNLSFQSKKEVFINFYELAITETEPLNFRGKGNRRITFPVKMAKNATWSHIDNHKNITMYRVVN